MLDWCLAHSKSSPYVNQRSGLLKYFTKRMMCFLLFSIHFRCHRFLSKKLNSQPIAPRSGNLISLIEANNQGQVFSHSVTSRPLRSSLWHALLASVAWRHPFLLICFHLISESRADQPLIPAKGREGRAGQRAPSFPSFPPSTCKALSKVLAQSKCSIYCNNYYFY